MASDFKWKVNSRRPVMRVVRLKWSSAVQRLSFVSAVLLLIGCGNEVEPPHPSTKGISPLAEERRDRSPTSENFTAKKANVRGRTSPGLTTEAFEQVPFTEVDGMLTVEGTLEGTWLRQQSGETLGNLSKATILEPLRLTVGSRSLPLVGTTTDLELALLENSGKTVRLRGHLTKWIEHGRGGQGHGFGAGAGYNGPIPAHVVQFLTVVECEVVIPTKD